MKYPDLFNSDISRVGTRESQMYNIIAGQLMAQTVMTSFGPRGMEKVYIDIIGESTITKHGGAFLRKLDTDHPAAKTIVDAVNTVDTHVGDGTVASAILIGALLRHAQALLKKKMPTAAITRGFERGMETALKCLDEIKIESNHTDRQLMEQLLDSCLGGKAIFDSLSENSKIKKIIIDAVYCVTDFAKQKVDVDDIKIEEKPGNSSDIQLVMGTVIDKSIDSSEMPNALQNIKVLLLNDPLESMQTKTESKIEIISPHQMSQFLKQEDTDVLLLVKKIVDSGAKVVISRKGIGNLAQEYLAKEGIISIRRAKYNDLWWLEKSTGAKTCESVEKISQDELGSAYSVREQNIGGDPMLFVESKTPKSVTILLRSASKMYLDEFHRTVKNAVFVLRNFIENPFIVFGGGSCEAIIAHKIREHSYLVEGKEQLAMQRFADALEEIPLTLARNVGMNALEVLSQLRARQAKASRRQWYGVNSLDKSVQDMSLSGIVDIAVVKEQMFKTAVEAANMILNVDDVFMKDLIDNTHSHMDGTVHTHKDPGKNHNQWEQEGIEQRPMHHHY